jgi:hypothetical protein
LAARVALGAVIDFLQRHGRPGLVRFVLFDDEAFGIFSKVLRELAP